MFSILHFLRYGFYDSHKLYYFWCECQFFYFLATFFTLLLFYWNLSSILPLHIFEIKSLTVIGIEWSLSFDFGRFDVWNKGAFFGLLLLYWSSSLLKEAFSFFLNFFILIYIHSYLFIKTVEYGVITLVGVVQFSTGRWHSLWDFINFLKRRMSPILYFWYLFGKRELVIGEIRFIPCGCKRGVE